MQLMSTPAIKVKRQALRNWSSFYCAIFQGARCILVHFDVTKIVNHGEQVISDTIPLVLLLEHKAHVLID